MAFHVGGAFMNHLVGKRDSRAQLLLDSHEKLLDSKLSPARSPAAVPVLDFSSLSASDRGQTRAAEEPSTPPSAPGLATCPSGAYAPARSARFGGGINRARSFSRRSIRRTFFLQSPEARTEADITAVDDMFYGTYACQHLTRSARLQLGRIAQLQQFDDGDVLCLPNTPMHCVYFLIGGQVEYVPHSADGAACQEETVVLEAPSSLGSFLPAASVGGHSMPGMWPQPTGSDLATPRTRLWPVAGVPRVWGGTATAVDQCDVAVVTQEQWQQLLAEDPRWDARQVASFLEDLPVFGQLSRSQLMRMARLMRVRSVPAGSLVFRQGTEGDEVFIVRRGYVRLLRELQVQHATRKSINNLTNTMAGLRHQLEVLTTPRTVLVHRQVQGLLYSSAGCPPSSTLGSMHMSGALTHRPRLQHQAGSSALSPRPSHDHLNSDSMHPSPSGASSPHAPGSPRQASPKVTARRGNLHVQVKLTTPGQEEDSEAGTTAHTTNSYTKFKVPPLRLPAGDHGVGPSKAQSPSSKSHSSTPISMHFKSPGRGSKHSTPRAGHGPLSPLNTAEGMISPKTKPRKARHKPKSGSDGSDGDGMNDEDTAAAAAALVSPRAGGGSSSPRKSSVKYDDSSAMQIQQDREAKAHLRDVGRASTRVMKHALSRRSTSLALSPQASLEVVAALSPPGAAEPGALGRSEGATDRLLETLKSKRFPEQSLLSADDHASSAAATPTSDNPPMTTIGSMARGSLARSGGLISGQLPTAARKAFASACPRHLGDEPVVFVEMGQLGSGRIFGEGNRGDTSKRRVVSAVADTNVEVLLLDRAEAEARLGDMATFLWNQEPMEGKPLVSDEAIRGQLEKTMRWEVYKKQLLQDVFVQKRARLDMR